MAASEYNAAPPEYASAREYGASGASSRAKRRSSARQRALMQAAAAILTVVTVAAGAPSIAPKTAEPPAPVESVTEPVVPAESAPEPVAPAVSEPESAAPTLTAEEQAFWDELSAACRAEDDAAIHALAHTAMFEALGARKLWNDPAFAEEPLRIGYSGYESFSEYWVRYFFRDDPAAKDGGRVLSFTDDTGSDGLAMISFCVFTDESPDGAQTVTAARGYYKGGDLKPGADYATLEQSDLYREMTGAFVADDVPERGERLFLEDGTLVTAFLTAYDGLPPLTFEVRGGYLQPAGQLTLEPSGDGRVYLNHPYTIDGFQRGAGVDPFFYDDPYYHTPLQETYIN